MKRHEQGAVFAMMRKLWPDFDDAMPDEHVIVLERDDDTLGGFISLAMRPWAEGCTSTPCAYIEGWWIEELRRQGHGRALVVAGERWARAQGSRELASDALISNTGSLAAHAALGFEEVERVVAFRKRL